MRRRRRSPSPWTATAIISGCRSPTTAPVSIRRGSARASACAGSRSACVSSAAPWRSTLRAGAARVSRSSCPGPLPGRPPLRVLLADDHGIVRRGLRSILEETDVSVVGEAADGLEAVRLCETLRPDMLIVDIGMPKLNGIDVAARVQKLDNPPRVLILSMHADESYIIRALASGARAYLLKDATDEDLLPAVRAVASGRPFFSPAVTAVLVQDYMRSLQTRGLSASYTLLTDREKT